MQIIQDWRILSAAKRCAIGVLALMVVLVQIAQPYPEIAWLQHIPTGLLILASPWLLRRWPVSDGAVVLIVLFFALHTLGGRWTYSNVPYDAWAQTLTGHSVSGIFGWQRNHYDRLIHFLFGALFYTPVREWVMRYRGLTPGMATAFAFGFVLAAGALYEIFEGLLSFTVSAGLADDYNGQQGDWWDAQKDMGVAFGGTILAWAWMRMRRGPR